MTTHLFSTSLISIVSDLSTNISAEQRYQNLLEHLCRIFPCDSSALLKFENPCLVPPVVRGLSGNTLGVTLIIDEMPRGVLTLDALTPGTFDHIDPLQLNNFIRLTAATVKAAGLNASLEQRMRYVTQPFCKENIDYDMIGDSECMRKLRSEISIVAPSELAVLILGETEVGKELVARHIHLESGRSDQIMVYVNQPFVATRSGGGAFSRCSLSSIGCL